MTSREDLIREIAEYSDAIVSMLNQYTKFDPVYDDESVVTEAYGALELGDRHDLKELDWSDEVCKRVIESFTDPNVGESELKDRINILRQSLFDLLVRFCNINDEVMHLCMEAGETACELLGIDGDSRKTYRELAEELNLQYPELPHVSWV